MDLPGPDPEAMRWSARLHTALTVAATTDDHDIGPAMAIIDEMVARRLQGGPRERVLSSALFYLSCRHVHDRPGLPDPYRPLKDRLLANGQITQADINVAVHGQTLAVGLRQGWLPAGVYDDLTELGGAGPEFRELMTRIERRPDAQPPITLPAEVKP